MEAAGHSRRPRVAVIDYGMGNLRSVSRAMVAAGATPIDTAPRPGSRGTTVAFIHPKGACGTLIELVQE